jgi:hypothetical protein
MRRLQLRCIKRGEKTYVDYIFYSKIVVNDFGVIETYENEGHVKWTKHASQRNAVHFI